MVYILFSPLFYLLQYTPIHDNFSKPFTLETNANNHETGVVLSQDGKPLAFLSQAPTLRHQGLNIYKKELMAILMAVEKW